jgi:CDGSH-type Zn-finger protein/uncharacterized Fe-S cluster protein YjdI
MQHSDIVIQDREELFYLLSEAAEFEHAVMCTYLYAMWSLKRHTSEGVSPQELAAIDRWRRSLRQVALEEMLHLSLVNNLLAATGASPHLWRPEFPVHSGWFPADVVMRLAPFGEDTIDHFMYLERPEGIAMVDGAGFDHPAHHPRAERPELLTPTPRDYASQGQLYHSVLRGLARLVAEIGEPNVFVGHGEAQVSSAEFGMPGLFKITNLQAARRAVDEIVRQGEGAPAHRAGSHYERFAAIREEFLQLRHANPHFEPARPVVTNPSIDNPRGRADVVVISDPLTAKVVDLGNALYALMVRTFAQVFSPAPLPRDLRVGFAAAVTEIMYAMSYVGEAATRLPLGPEHPGVTAGLTLSLILSSGQLVQRCAAQILGERVHELARAARQLELSVPLLNVSARLEAVAGRFATLHGKFEEHLSLDEVAHPTGPSPVAPPPPASGDPNMARTEAITLRFAAARCIHSRHCVLGAPSVFLANVKGQWLHPETVPANRVAEIAHACPSGAITYERHDGGPQESAPAVNVLRVRENGPYAVHAAIAVAGGDTMFRATFCRCGKSQNKPFCDNSHRAAAFAATGEPASIASDPLPARGGALNLTPIVDGPLEVLGNLEICSGTGRTVFRSQNVRLCRCGGSANKPFCDGTHARIGFRSQVAPSPTASTRSMPA